MTTPGFGLPEAYMARKLFVEKRKKSAQEDEEKSTQMNISTFKSASEGKAASGCFSWVKNMKFLCNNKFTNEMVGNVKNRVDTEIGGSNIIRVNCWLFGKRAMKFLEDLATKGCFLHDQDVKIDGSVTTRIEKNSYSWINKSCSHFKEISSLVQLKGCWYPDLVKIFYQNLKLENIDIHSRVKGVDILINNDTWEQVIGLKAEGVYPFPPTSEENCLLKKKDIYKGWLRSSDNHYDEKFFSHEGLKMEERIMAHILVLFILPGRLLEPNLILRGWCFKGEENLLYLYGSTSVTDEQRKIPYSENNCVHLATNQLQEIVNKLDQLEIKVDHILQQSFEEDTFEEDTMDSHI
ncbi:hypothetical protein V8G54_035472 [Vigna mungo]|uniref:Uncharacterized protein n=1 Tax=Vigna mungo TaxID=3915 RepID=A0AAQ3RAZ6_VIGMU